MYFRHVEWASKCEPINVNKLASLFAGNINEYYFLVERQLDIKVKKNVKNHAVITIRHGGDVSTVAVRKPTHIHILGSGFLVNYPLAVSSVAKVFELFVFILPLTKVKGEFESGTATNHITLTVVSD